MNRRIVHFLVKVHDINLRRGPNIEPFENGKDFTLKNESSRLHVLYPNIDKIEAISQKIQLYCFRFKL